MSVDLRSAYLAYIDCLNRRAWCELERHVHPMAEHNGRTLGLSGYRAMLERDVERIPDLRFAVDLLAVDPPTVAARLLFDCRPEGAFMGLDVGGQRVRFSENVFYRFEGGLVRRVWSVVDGAAIAAQLA